MKALNLSRSATRRACERGEVPGARRIGRRWYIHPEAFAAGFAHSHQPRLAAPRRSPSPRLLNVGGPAAKRILETALAEVRREG